MTTPYTRPGWERHVPRSTFDFMRESAEKGVPQQVVESRKGPCTHQPIAVYRKDPDGDPERYLSGPILFRGPPIQVSNGLVPKWAVGNLDTIQMTWHCDDPMCDRYYTWITSDRKNMEPKPLDWTLVDGTAVPQIAPDIGGWMYRLFDGLGDLLYVGISVKNPDARVKSHYVKPWGHSIRRVEMEFHDANLASLEVEAIRTEHPLHNIQHNQ